MHYLADAYIAKRIDEFSINNIGIPSVVLMERAAQSVADVIVNDTDYKKIIAICGKGNNGGDAIAAVRILHDRGYDCTIFSTTSDDNLSDESQTQIKIARNNKINVIYDIEKLELQKYDVIIDGLFGVGLSKKVKGDYNRIIDMINESGCKVYSIDVPSGINCSDGSVMGNAVFADVTVTFGYKKIGLMLYPGREYSGKVIVSDKVFPIEAYNRIRSDMLSYDYSDITLLPARKNVSNKGTYGHVLVIAGGEDMSGASLLSAKAAYRTGCGLVKVITHENNRAVIGSNLPEAIISTYETTNDITNEYIINNIKWADSVVLGPGIGMSDTAEHIVSLVLSHNDKPIVIDADAINIIAGNTVYKDNHKWRDYAVLTPHLKEMSRLIENMYSASEIHDNILSVTKEYEYKNAVLVLKDAVTITCNGEKMIINNSGNNGMATAGSGDVLTGIIASLMAQGMDRLSAASLGVFIHGLAGDAAANEGNKYSLIASDIIEQLQNVCNYCNK